MERIWNVKLFSFESLIKSPVTKFGSGWLLLYCSYYYLFIFSKWKLLNGPKKFRSSNPIIKLSFIYNLKDKHSQKVSLLFIMIPRNYIHSHVPDKQLQVKTKIRLKIWLWNRNKEPQMSHLYNMHLHVTQPTYKCTRDISI